MMSDRNGISPPKARRQVFHAGVRIALLSAFLWSLFSGSAFGLGLVEYYGEKIVYVPVSEIGQPHHWSFELQNNGDSAVDVAVLVESPLVYLESQRIVVAPFSSKKVTLTVMLPPDIHYSVGDFADVPFEVAYVEGGTTKTVSLKKGIRGWLGIVVGDKNQPPVSDIHQALRDTGQPMESFRLAEDELGPDFYKPVSVTNLPIPPKPVQPSSGLGMVFYLIIGGIIIIMCSALLLHYRAKSVANRSFRRGVSYLSAFLLFSLLFTSQSALAADSASYDVSAEILEEMVMTQILTSTGQGISGFLTGMTTPVVTFTLSLGLVFVVLAIIYVFGSTIKSFFRGGEQQMADANLNQS